MSLQDKPYQELAQINKNDFLGVDDSHLIENQKNASINHDDENVIRLEEIREREREELKAPSNDDLIPSYS